MQATASVVIKTAQQVYLNDFNQVKWTKDQLFPFLQEAHRNMQLELQLNGIPVIKNFTFVTTVPPITATWPGYVLPSTWTTAMPTNIIDIINVWERPTGDVINSDWDLMIPKSFIPKEQPVDVLVYWSWLQEMLVLLGATSSNDIRIDYNGGLTIPASDDDLMGWSQSESYLAPKLAALAQDSIGGDRNSVKNHKMAEIAMDKLLCSSVLSEQGMVTRRRPYRHGSVPFVIR